MTSLDASTPRPSTQAAPSRGGDYFALALRTGCSRLRAIGALAAMVATWVAGTLVAGAMFVAVPGIDLMSDELTSSPTMFIVVMANVILAFLPAGMVGGWIATRRSPLRLWSARGPFRVSLFLASTGIAAVVALGVTVISTVLSGGLLSGPVLTSGTLLLLAAIVLMAPLQSLGEEIFFRGTLVQVVAVVLPHGTLARRRVGILLSAFFGAALFAAIHGPTSILQFTMYLVGGLTLYLVTGWLAGIEASTGAHAALNIVLFVPMALQVEFAPVPAWQMAAQVAGFDVLAGVAIGLLCRRWSAGRSMLAPEPTGPADSPSR